MACGIYFGVVKKSAPQKEGKMDVEEGHVVDISTTPSDDLKEVETHSRVDVEPVDGGEPFNTAAEAGGEVMQNQAADTNPFVRDSTVYHDDRSHTPQLTALETNVSSEPFSE